MLLKIDSAEQSREAPAAKTQEAVSVQRGEECRDKYRDGITEECQCYQSSLSPDKTLNTTINVNLCPQLRHYGMCFTMCNPKAKLGLLGIELR